MEEFQKFQKNLQVLTYFNPKTFLKKSTSIPICRNLVIIDEKDTDFINQDI